MINWFDNKVDMFAAKVAMPFEAAADDYGLESTKQGEVVQVKEDVKYQM